MATTSISAGQLAAEIRRGVIVQSRRANVGHIGSSLSIADIMAALVAGPLREHVGSPDPNRDRLVLSKGHACLALYCALRGVGGIDQAQLDTFSGDGTLLGSHPEHALPGVDFSTGSLGHGLSIGAGAAQAARLQGSRRRTYVVMSDAECDEGSTWEAVMYAAQHQLGGLTAIVDVNGQQAFGYTADVMSLEPLAARWSSFGWDVVEHDGHDVAGLEQLLDVHRPADAQPRVVLAQTVFGSGVSFMERQIKWHYLPLDDDQFAQALAELEARA
jgi:transketolase